MPRIIVALFFNVIIVASVYSQYSEFPFIGWQQTFISFTWTGTQNQIGITTLSFDRDTLINGQWYISNGFTHFRSQEGKIYQNKYDWQTESFHEVLEYDFSLNIGDEIINETYAVEDSAKVINKERIINLLGDSIWQIDIQIQLNFIIKDTITWIEGVGNLNSGLIKTNFPDGGLTHACTLLPDNKKMFINHQNSDYCNCRYKYGIDMDNDGYGNYTSRMAEVYLGFHFNNPSAKKAYKVRGCDTIKIVSSDLNNIKISSNEECNGNFISIDSFSNLGPNGEVLYSYFIYNMDPYSKVYLSDQCSWDFAEITIDPCFQDDCDDNDPYINPNAEEIPNNGIDEDCDGMDLTTAINELVDTAVRIYPNPASNSLNIEVENSLHFKVSLFDFSGTQILSSRNERIINVNLVPQGIYLLEFEDLKSHQKIVEKIIISR